MTRSAGFTAVIATVAAVLALAAPALAQSAKGRNQPTQKSSAPTEDPRERKAKEEAYRNALKSIPDSKEAVDPWKNAR